MGQKRSKQRLKLPKLLSSMRQKPVIPKKQSRKAVPALTKRAHSRRKVTIAFLTPLTKRRHLPKKAMATLLIEERDSSSSNEGDSKFWKAFWVFIAFMAVLAVVTIIYLIYEKIAPLIDLDSLSRLRFFWDCLGVTVLTSVILLLIVVVALAIVRVKARITKTETNFDQESFANCACFFWIFITVEGYVLQAVSQKEMLLQNLPAITLAFVTMSLVAATLRVFLLCVQEAFCCIKKEKRVRAFAIEAMALTSFVGVFLTIVTALLDCT